MEGFCDRVLDELIHLTQKEKRAIRAELEAHLADHAAALEDRGFTPEEARAKAEEAMGDPMEVGRALARQYPRFWLWAYRFLTLVLLVGCVLFLIRGPVYRVRSFLGNLAAREDPWSMDFVYPYQDTITREVDFQIEMETDTLRIIRVGVNQENLTASVYFVNYDRNPWGLPAEPELERMSVTTQAGEVREYTGSLVYEDWTGPGAAFGDFLYIPIQPGDTYLTLRYDRFGTEAVFELPLPEWEGER